MIEGLSEQDLSGQDWGGLTYLTLTSIKPSYRERTSEMLTSLSPIYVVQRWRELT